MVFSLVALCVVVPWLVMVVYTGASRGMRAALVSTVLAIPVTLSGVLFSMDILKNMLGLSGDITLLLISVYILDLIMWSAGIYVISTVERMGNSVKTVILMLLVLFLGAFANFFIYDNITVSENLALSELAGAVNTAVADDGRFVVKGQDGKFDITLKDRDDFPSLEGLFSAHMKQKQKDNIKKMTVYQAFVNDYEVEALLGYPEKSGDAFVSKAVYRASYKGTAWIRFNELFFALLLLGGLGYVAVSGKEQ